MKKFILGISFMLSGIIGFGTWIIANMLTIQPGGVSSVMSGLRATNAVPMAVLFLSISIIGVVISLLDISNNK